ncbi:ATP-dependent RNA helicase [Vairimorpha necatrix]|uniref:ATP-dependent RNA helicase n=1 Tax=Vairimorpha necatrix TaxID=6039 RepID=A0AAX4J9M8_9MICR
MDEIKKIKGGSFKTLNLNKNLLYNIPFSNPTPIQRKIIPLILKHKSVLGIGRTGSGKTYCYLIPTLQRALENENILIIVPTRELITQVKRNIKYLSRNINIPGTIEVITPYQFTSRSFDLLVVDEIDRILEEKDLRKEFENINEKLECQKIFFSATKPDIHLDMEIVEVDNKINENIKYKFYYIPSISKESVLLNILFSSKADLFKLDLSNSKDVSSSKLDSKDVSSTKDLDSNIIYSSKPDLTNLDINKSNKDHDKLDQISNNKIVIFVGTKYTVDYLLEILKDFNYKSKGIYSSMDTQARLKNYKDFINNKFNILIVTDLAARGLDIPLLDTVINYDLSDDRTFIHRVGRIRGTGTAYSFVTYQDIFHFYNIQETYLKNVELGTLPSKILDKYNVEKYLYLKNKTTKGYEKCLKFRNKVCVPEEYKNKINEIEIHSDFKTKELLNNKLQKHFNKKKIKEKKIEEDNKFRDQFYIPYNRKDSKIYSSVFGVMKDDYVKEKREKYNYKRARTKTRSKL